MTSVDLALCAVTVVSAVIGLYRGLVKELLSLLIWLAALLLGLLLAGDVARALFGWIEQGTLALLSGFVLVFIATVVAGAGLQWLMGRLVAGSGLGGSDRVLGLLFGAARGLVVVLVGLVALRPFFEDQGWWQSSALITQLLLFEGQVLAWIERLTGLVSDMAAAA